jgi:glycosyltransferase involved in cell wall biosynthesis
MGTADVPEVSVVLPVYNAERYLRQAVESVLRQTLGDFELICIDDGSTDGTLAILREYERADARVRVISRANTGVSRAANEGTAAARAPLLARMDGDDICMPERLEKQAAYLHENPDCVLVASQVVVIDGDGGVVGPRPDTGYGHEEIDRALLDRGWPVVHPSVMVRTRAVRNVGGYPDGVAVHEDHDLFLRLAEVGRLHTLPDVLLHYRQHFSGATLRSKREERERLMRRIVREACARRGIPVPPALEEVRPEQSWSDLRRDWAWRALMAGNVATARRHAWGVLKEKPWSKESWRLAACAVRGR